MGSKKESKVDKGFIVVDLIEEVSKKYEK